MNKRPPTLLIVEDEELLLEVLVDEFKIRGVRCLAATNPVEGLKLFKSESPDAILSDINMPEMSGIDFLKILRKEGHDTPFIVLSGYGDQEKVAEARRLGAFDFLDKPFEREVLRAVVGQALKLGMETRLRSSDGSSTPEST